MKELEPESIEKTIEKLFIEVRRPRLYWQAWKRQYRYKHCRVVDHTGLYLLTATFHLVYRV